MKPTLYLICGLPCSGKTTFAEKLCREVNGVVFSSDEWIIKKYGLDFLSPTFYEHLNEARENIALEAEQLIKKGHNVILDYGFYSKTRRDEYRKKAQEWGANVVLYYLDIPFEVLAERLAKRNKKLPKYTFYVTEEMLHNFSKNFEPPVESGLKIIRIH